MFLIKSERGWVAKDWHETSYTKDLRHAKRFASRKDAEFNLYTDNEQIQPLDEALDELKR